MRLPRGKPQSARGQDATRQRHPGRHEPRGRQTVPPQTRPRTYEPSEQRRNATPCTP
jgi:hypothetical protein